jgi:hypothetical protein
MLKKSCQGALLFFFYFFEHDTRCGKAPYNGRNFIAHRWKGRTVMQVGSTGAKDAKRRWVLYDVFLLPFASFAVFSSNQTE